jgi:ribose/xylose/arabinose/galactoside ABC-type transport system permease subunit
VTGGIDLSTGTVMTFCSVMAGVFVTTLGLPIFTGIVAALVAGIPLDVLMFCGIAGVVMASRLSSAQPALGPGYEMDAIAAAVIGGASLSGGEGSILGTVIGAFVIMVLTNGLWILSVPQEWQMVVAGLIVIGAMYLDIARRKIKQAFLTTFWLLKK